MLCTRPALKPFFTFFHKIGEIVYPTKRSKIRRACCASTKSISNFLGFLNASFTASFVISLNSTRIGFVVSNPNKCAKCHEIASPSLSGSLAR